MNLYGILIAKDEADIIEQTLLSLKEFGGFKKIFFYDNGSIDNTAEIAKKFNDFVSVKFIDESYSDSLKYTLIYQHVSEYKDGDWLAILDADELYVENVLKKITTAEFFGANCVEYSDAQFYFTEQDDFQIFSPHIPIIQQRQHYLVNYGEPRIFKYSPEIELTELKVKSRFDWLKIAPEKLLVNHFQYRSAQQVQHRIDVRLANHGSSNNWGHIKQKNWQDYLVKSAWLHRFNGEHHFGLPDDANLYKIPDNPAYTSASLKWMLANNGLTAEQKAFFNASRLERLWRKLF